MLILSLSVIFLVEELKSQEGRKEEERTKRSLLT